MNKHDLGESIAREWQEEPRAPELWDALDATAANADIGLKKLEQLAVEGSSLAQMYLGHIRLTGDYGVPKDWELGEYWLRRSAGGESTEGAYLLAWHLLTSGKADEAVTQYQRLAKLGYSPALYVLGCLYKNGEVVEGNTRTALSYFSAAAEAGHLHAAHWVCHILMRERVGSLSWLHGLAKKIALTVPFITTLVWYPSSDRLRT